MAYPVQNNSAPQYNDALDAAEGMSDYDPSFMNTDELSDDHFVEDGEDNGGETQVDLSPQGLRNRLKELNALLHSSNLDSATQRSLEKEIRNLQGKINFAESLSPRQRQSKLEEIAGQMGDIESKIYGIGQEDVSEMTGSDGQDLSQGGLENKTKDLEDKITNLFKEGAITEEVRDELTEKLGRIENELKGDAPDLEMVDMMCSDLSDKLSEFKGEFVSTGKAVESTGEEAEDDPSASPTFDNLLSTIGGGMGEKDLLEKIRSYYPSLDSDGNGTLSRKELDKAIKEKTWPNMNGPDQTMLNFLSDADKEFKTYFDQASQDGFQSWKKASNRLVNLLQAMYPDKKDNIKVADWNTDARSWCNIWFDGVLSSFANKQVDQCSDRTLCDNSKPPNSLVFTTWNQTSDGAWYPQGATFEPNRPSGMRDSLGAVVADAWDSIF